MMVDERRLYKDERGWHQYCSSWARRERESTLSRRTMIVKYEVERSENKCRSSSQGSPYAYVWELKIYSIVHWIMMAKTVSLSRSDTFYSAFVLSLHFFKLRRGDFASSLGQHVFPSVSYICRCRCSLGGPISARERAYWPNWCQRWKKETYSSNHKWHGLSLAFAVRLALGMTRADKILIS